MDAHTPMKCPTLQLQESCSCDTADRDRLLLSVHNLVKMLVRQRVRDPERAEDVVQDVCLRILHTWSHWDKARGQASTWTKWQVRSVVARSGERAKRRAARYKSLTEKVTDGLYADDGLPAEAVERAEVVALVREAVAALDDATAELLHARHVDGESGNGIARRMGRSGGVVHRRLVHAEGDAMYELKRRGLSS
ncbi:RNA polymerase sigma factor [Limnoglobus roseus]|uniref:Sigma-70 family RNA polymerase sigma factor n=1 Tax=Limnoglobus roseus TaxID=2598579 RepID=A0A5C1AHM1_9BACT|nr:sigma-70 family RNA polymerase sigma factor [Limnoglobus roseus]QEL18330.1 sigma-70 family RNA polymerase sigma factor [Limnoglobus roseus]